MSYNTLEQSDQDSWKDVEIFLSECFTNWLWIEKLYISDFMNDSGESILECIVDQSNKTCETTVTNLWLIKKLCKLGPVLAKHTSWQIIFTFIPNDIVLEAELKGFFFFFFFFFFVRFIFGKTIYVKLLIYQQLML